MSIGQVWDIIKIFSASKLETAENSDTPPVYNVWNFSSCAEREKDRNEEILDLYLEGWTEAEIGRKLATSRQTVSNTIVNAKKGINSQIGIPDPPQIGDVWLFSSCDDAYGISGFPGRRRRTLSRR